MTIVSQPDVTVNIVPASNEVSNAAQVALIVGQKIAAGTAVAGQLYENVLNDNSWETLAGKKSQLAAMIREFKKLNKVTQLDFIPLDDSGTAVDAAGEMEFVGTATEAGTLICTVGSKVNHKYSISVAIDDTATEIGDKLVTAITADDKSQVSAVNTTGAVAITAENGGTIGNDIGLRIEGSVAGITHSVTAMSAGANDPTLTDVLDVVGDKRYQTIVWPYADLAVIESFLDDRFNVSNNVLDGVAVTYNVDSLANTLTTLDALNSQSIVVECDKLVSETSYKGPSILELPYVKIAQFSSVRALRRTEGANISRFVITRNGALDSFGGPAISSKPYFNTPMPNLPVINTGKGWKSNEPEQIKSAGGFVMGNNTAANSIIVGEVLTTYKTDSAGNEDETFKYLNYVDTASSAREYFFNNLKSRFAQSRLTEGDLVPNRDMANENSIASYCTKLYSDLSGQDFVLTQAGEDALNFYNSNLSVGLNLLTGTATITMSVPIVTQLRTLVVTFKIEFSTNG